MDEAINIMFIPTDNNKSSNFDYYSSSLYLEYDQQTNMYVPYNSLFLNRLRSLPVSGTFDFDRYDTIGRFDLISYELYSTTKLWWVLFLYNNLYSFLDLVQGVSLKYPSKSDIDSMIVSLSNPEGMWL